jgi:hypothetical protein
MDVGKEREQGAEAFPAIGAPETPTLADAGRSYLCPVGIPAYVLSPIIVRDAYPTASLYIAKHALSSCLTDSLTAPQDFYHFQNRQRDQAQARPGDEMQQ